MATKRVVPGSLTDAYKRREGDFAPNLVGVQNTSNGGTPFFTLGNFAITSNLEGRVAKNFKLGEWSEEYSLLDLNLTEEQSETLSNQEIFVNVNYNKSDLSRYVYFGNFSKFLESEIRDILNKWPASLYVVDIPPYQSERNFPVNTVLNYSYDQTINQTTFKIPTAAIENKFGLNYSQISSGTNDITDIPTAYSNYVILSDNVEYPILGFTGSSENYPYLDVIVDGNPLSELSGSTFGTPTYHFKPKHQIVEEFFNNLSEFGEVILDRLIKPKYTLKLEKPFKSDMGTIVYTTVTSTWPTSDGYNLDTDTQLYNDYLEDIFSYAKDFDETKTDLIVRRFVSESILEWDTDGGGDEVTGMKVKKLLRIYGRGFDEVKKYIDGISFANVVSYSKKDNTSDNLIKMMAKTLGFDTLLSLGTNDFNIIDNITPGAQPQFDGYSKELSPKEMDIELWRRLVINAWWLFKSKGTRKVLEFFLKLFGINECLVDLNESVYLAKDKLDVSDTILKLIDVVGETEISLNLNNYPFDDFGFPKVLPNTSGRWFQNDGFWYNGGNDRVTGNNPHFGPYDFGQRYFDKYRCFVDGFTGRTVQEITQINETNFFLDYNEGTFSPYESGLAISSYGESLPNFLLKPNDNAEIISAGLVTTDSNDGPPIGPSSGDTYSMRITFNAGESEQCDPCQYNLTWNRDGLVYYEETDFEGNLQTLPLKDERCCEGYWLPLIKPTKCPNPGTLVITVEEGIITSNGKPLPQECCSKTFVGGDVTWDGRNCIINKFDNVKCDKIIMSITLNKEVINSQTGKPIPQECCTKTFVGGDVTWDGRNCILNVEGDKTEPNNEYRTKQKEEEYNIFGTRIPNEEILRPADGLQPKEEEDSSENYYCWWCPPNTQLTTVCSPKEFINTLNLSEKDFISRAQSYGFKGTTYEQAVTFIERMMSSFFTKGNCILMIDSTGEVLNNSACCEIRGGTWDEKNKLCLV